MSYVPTLCLQCSRVHLVSLASAQSDDRACETCGAATRIVPGCSFSAADRGAFEELSAIVAEGAVTPMEAGHYAAAVEQALWSGAYVPAMDKLSERLPGLLPSQVAAGRNTGALRGILAKLKTVLDALATATNRSGEYAVVASQTARSAEGTDVR